MSQKITPGSVFTIDLPCKKIAYGRILINGDYAFYDKFTEEPVDQIDDIVNQKILFIVAVHKSAINSGRWEKIGFVELDDSVKMLPMKFMQDPNNLELIQSYDPVTGKTARSNYESSVGLEKLAAWEANHVEERLCDHLAGRPNVWVERMKLKKPDSEE